VVTTLIATGTPHFTMGIMSIVTVQADKAAFDCILNDPAFGEIEAHPQTGAYARSYYPAVHGSDHVDLSFAVCSVNTPVVVGLCSLIDKTLGLHGLPARLFARNGISPELYRNAMRAAFAHIDEIASTKGAREVVIRERAVPALSPIGEASIAREAQAAVSLIGRVDLTAGLVRWRKALRKSFRSLINWGRANLEVTYVNAADCNRDRFDGYRLFHAEIAGRVTRPLASWDAMYAWLASGRGELICAALDSKLAAASLFIDGTETCIYMSGVYDRALEKPLAHFMIWHGIERAQQRGMKIFELGDVPFSGTVSDKEYQIGYFKRGFVTDIDAYLTWQWPLRHENPQQESE